MTNWIEKATKKSIKESIEKMNQFFEMLDKQSNEAPYEDGEYDFGANLIDDLYEINSTFGLFEENHDLYDYLKTSILADIKHTSDNESSCINLYFKTTELRILFITKLKEWTKKKVELINECKLKFIE